MSIFKRLFKVGEANTHAIIDKFEDPIKMTEQGIRDLKKDLHEAMISLAEVKSITIRTRKEADNNKKLAGDYERKAMMLLQKMEKGEMEQSEAERLATSALEKKEVYAIEAVRLSQEAENHEKMSNSLQANVNKIKSVISNYEKDLTTLKARAKAAVSSKKINAQLAKIDSSGTIAMLEKMKFKVEEDESLAHAYGEIVSAAKTVDDEIEVALGGSSVTNSSDKLLELKKKMGMK